MSTPRLEASIAELSVRHAELAALTRLAYVAGTAEDLDSLLQAGGEEVLRAFGADSVGIYLTELDPKTLHNAYVRGVSEEDQARYGRISREHSLAEAVSRDGQPRCWQVEDYPAAARPLMAQSAFRTAAAAALRSRGRVLGTLHIAFQKPMVLTAAQLHLLGAMSAHFAAGLEAQQLLVRQRAVDETNARLYAEVRTRAAELARTQAQLVQREHLASLGEMVAVLAHEIRNPLGVLANSLAVARRHQPGDALLGVLVETMGQEVERMNRLVEQLLDFARPPEAIFRPESVAPLLEEVARAAAAQAGPGGVQVCTEVEAELPPVLMDVRLMRQAVLNVAINGLEAMHRPGQLRLVARAAEGGVRIEVVDEGCGISSEVRPRIFEPFFTTKPTGIGLGLALVRRIVEEHRGRIEVASTPAGGTCFGILLPGARD